MHLKSCPCHLRLCLVAALKTLEESKQQSKEAQSNLPPLTLSAFAILLSPLAGSLRLMPLKLPALRELFPDSEAPVQAVLGFCGLMTSQNHSPGQHRQEDSVHFIFPQDLGHS